MLKAVVMVLFVVAAAVAHPYLPVTPYGFIPLNRLRKRECVTVSVSVRVSWQTLVSPSVRERHR